MGFEAWQPGHHADRLGVCTPRNHGIPSEVEGRANWCNSAGKRVANRDLWEELEEVTRYHEVTWIHVGGHSEQTNHERCDSLAVTAARAAKRDSARA